MRSFCPLAIRRQVSLPSVTQPRGVDPYWHPASRGSAAFAAQLRAEIHSPVGAARVLIRTSRGRQYPLSWTVPGFIAVRKLDKFCAQRALVLMSRRGAGYQSQNKAAFFERPAIGAGEVGIDPTRTKVNQNEMAPRERCSISIRTRTKP